MWSFCLLICLSLFASGFSSSRTDPVVQTKVGAIRGLHATNGDYDMFKGIPYARIDPNNPFAPPLPREPFETIYNAIDDSARCPQGGGQGTVDCLQLSIFAPSSATAQNPLPVMLWIHGGAFQGGAFGSNRFGPTYLMQRDVILVMINYRVGLYGFMCLDIPEVPGNAGLKDQAAAIKWVKENIAAFGGDENNITLFGGSAGGASVDIQFRYNKNDDFNKVIMQSGTAAGSWAIQRSDPLLAIKIANQLGVESPDSLEAVKFLATQSPSTVLSAYNKLGVETWPCVEQEFTGVFRLIPDYAMNLEIPRANNTPILVGYNDDEWLSRYANQNPEYFKTLNIFKQNLLEAFILDDKEVEEIESIVKEFYLGSAGVTAEKVLEIAAFDTDFTFVHPIETAIRQYISNSGTDIYRYFFTYVGNRNQKKYEMNTDLGGAYHGDEKGYLFDVDTLPAPTEEDQLMIDRLTTMWTNFAKYGNPTPEPTDLLPITWPKITKEGYSYLEIGKEFSVKDTPLPQRVAFWDLVYLLNKTRQVGYKSESQSNSTSLKLFNASKLYFFLVSFYISYIAFR